MIQLSLSASCVHSWIGKLFYFPHLTLKSLRREVECVDTVFSFQNPQLQVKLHKTKEMRQGKKKIQRFFLKLLTFTLPSTKPTPPSSPLTHFMSKT